MGNKLRTCVIWREYFRNISKPNSNSCYTTVCSAVVVYDNIKYLRTSYYHVDGRIQNYLTGHHRDVTPPRTLKPELQRPRSAGGRARNKSRKIPRQDEPLDCYGVPTDHARSRAGRRFLIPTNPSRCGGDGDRLKEH